VGDVEDMSQNAIHILSDDDRLQTFKAAALKRAKKFDKKTIIPMYEKLYKEVIEAYAIQKHQVV